jgi:TRAP transporter TAXI family solute receptor
MKLEDFIGCGWRFRDGRRDGPGAAGQAAVHRDRWHGGVYYPLAGGFGTILAKELPGITATAEVTGGSLDNMKLVGGGNADIAFTQVDTAVDAVNGRDKFPKKLGIRALVVMYPNLMQVVTLEGNGITNSRTSRASAVSTGAPGSGTEIFSSASSRVMASTRTRTCRASA